MMQQSRWGGSPLCLFPYGGVAEETAVWLGSCRLIKQRVRGSQQLKRHLKTEYGGIWWPSRLSEPNCWLWQQSMTWRVHKFWCYCAEINTSSWGTTSPILTSLLAVHKWKKLNMTSTKQHLVLLCVNLNLTKCDWGCRKHCPEIHEMLSLSHLYLWFPSLPKAHDHWQGLEHKLTSKQRALPSGLALFKTRLNHNDCQSSDLLYPNHVMLCCNCPNESWR